MLGQPALQWLGLLLYSCTVEYSLLHSGLAEMGKCSLDGLFLLQRRGTQGYDRNQQSHLDLGHPLKASKTDVNL